MDRSWIQKSRNCVFRAGELYEAGVNGFLDFAFSKVPIGGKITCPCVNCINQRPGTRDDVFEHLIVDGIMSGYTVWSFHGEVASSNTTAIETSNTMATETSNTMATENSWVDEENKDMGNIHYKLSHSFIVGSRRKRGRTRALQTNHRPNSDKLTVALNGYGQIVGPNAAEFSTYLGTLVRSPTMLPLSFPEWRKVPPHHKENVWNELKEKFNINDEGKRVVFMRMAKMWRNFKVELRKEIHERYPSLDGAPRPTDPVDIPEDQWEYLKRRWTSEDWLGKSRKNKEIREKQKISHTAGRKSFAQVSEELHQKKPDGVEPSRIVLFMATHKRKDGQNVDEGSQMIMEKVEKNLDEQPPEKRDDRTVQGNIFMEAVGPESRGRVRGPGLGIKPSTLGLTQKHIDIRHQQEEIQARIEWLEAKLEGFDELKATVARLSQELLLRHTSQSSVHLSDT